MKLTNLLWTLPFICFIGTYLALSYIFTAPTVATPSLIGKQLPEAFSILSNHDLNPRILREQVDNDVPAGTILSQTPYAGQKIKQHQQIFITVSKKADMLVAPDTVGKSFKEVEEQLKNSGIRNKTYHLTSKKPTGTIIAQIPETGIALEQNNMILYVSVGNTKQVICPEFYNRSVQEVIQFLAAYNIKPELYHTHLMREGHICRECKVIAQQPLAGSILDLEKGVTIQLKISDWI